MAQFDVYINNNKSAKDFPYLLDVQTDLLDDLNTRLVIPLINSAKEKNPIKNLNFVFEIEGKRMLMSTAEMAGVPNRSLGKKVTSLKNYRDKIIAAIDFLITGL